MSHTHLKPVRARESELHQETVADEKELDINHLSPEERVEIQAQLQTVRARYATEAVTLIVDHLFLNYDIIRIQAETHPENIPAQKVLEKNGFTREATIRKHTFSGGTWRDSALYRLLREEWTGPHYKW